jgi:hypothetical protein
MNQSLEPARWCIQRHVEGGASSSADLCCRWAPAGTRDTACIENSVGDAGVVRAPLLCAGRPGAGFAFMQIMKE